MKRLVWFVLGVCVCIVVVSYLALSHEPRVLPNVYVGKVSVGGLTREEAQDRLHAWWDDAKDKRIGVKVLRPSGEADAGYSIKISKLGVRLNEKACVEQLPVTNLWTATWNRITRPDYPKRTLSLRLTHTEAIVPTSDLKRLIENSMGSKQPATVHFIDGKIVRTPEVAGYAPDMTYFDQEIVKVLSGSGPLVVRVHESDKQMPDAELEKIAGVISEFSTRFPSNQANRNGNIRLAAEKIDGILLMPGEEFSFNKTVGERTVGGGYQLAGIFKNGKHEQGIGGGICQVSGTLYNAALLANLQISGRRNHSMPVAYLPVGRDATVDFGAIDLRFKNSLPSAIAITSQFQSGKLTFRILGHPDPGIKVKIVTEDHKISPAEVKVVHYEDAPMGEEFIVEKGSPAQCITTYRIVYVDGKVASKELLSKSRYAGEIRIVGKNLKAVSGSAQIRTTDKQGKTTSTNGTSADAPANNPRTPIGPPN